MAVVEEIIDLLLNKIFISFPVTGKFIPIKDEKNTIEGLKTSIAEEADFRLSSDERLEKMLDQVRIHVNQKVRLNVSEKNRVIQV